MGQRPALWSVSVRQKSYRWSNRTIKSSFQHVGSIKTRGRSPHCDRYLSSRNYVVGQIERLRASSDILEVVEDGVEIRITIEISIQKKSYCWPNQTIKNSFRHAWSGRRRGRNPRCDWYLSSRNCIVGQIERLRALSDTLEVVEDGAKVRFLIGIKLPEIVLPARSSHQGSFTTPYE